MIAEMSHSEAMMIVLIGGSGLAGVIVALLKLKTGIVNEIKGQLRADGAQPTPSVNILPNPLQMEPVVKFATSDAFGRHVAASRAEDEKLRNQTLQLERDLSHKIHVAKAEIMKAGEEREQRLGSKLDEHLRTERARVDKLMEGMGEIRGMIHHLANSTSGKKGGA
jgi:hypothetical protein